MAKVKGGLGENSLIQDLTKPIKFHISETLEGPPVFERQSPQAEEEVKVEKEVDLAISIIGKVARELDEGAFQVVFHIQGMSQSIVIESNGKRGEVEYSLKVVKGKNGDYSYVEWGESLFADFDRKEAVKTLSRHASAVEVAGEESFITFSSIDDFYEWLEM